MTRNQKEWRLKLQKERRWVDEYVSHLPPLRAEELVPGQGYHAVFYHGPECKLYSGRACNCKPVIKFYAEPVRS